MASCEVARDGGIFPLPLLRLQDLLDFNCVGLGGRDLELLVQVATACMAALNILVNDLKTIAFCGTSPNLAQRAVMTHVVSRTGRMPRRLKPEENVGPRQYLTAFKPAEAANRPGICADRIDLPTRAATCDPRRYCGDRIRLFLDHPKLIFPNETVGVGSVKIIARDRAEYTAFIEKALHAGKAELWE